MALGTKLKQILNERGITVKDFAIQIGIPPTTLYSFIKRDSETGKLDLIGKICKGLGIDITEFLDDDLFDAVTSPDEEYEEKVIDTKFESIIKNEKLSDEEKENMIQDLLSQLEIMQNVHESHAEISGQIILDALFNKLNLVGKNKAIEQVELLTKIPEYQEEPPTE